MSSLRRSSGGERKRTVEKSKGRPLRIVLTGGPGGGKSTVGDLLRREFGARVAFVPEAATLLFSGGFPRYPEEEARIALQSSIYAVQKSLEEAQHAHFSERVLLCDRGTIDGAVYWTDGPDAFFSHFGTTLQVELDRYDGVIFLESASVSRLAINSTMLEGGNAHRNEEADEAQRLDHKLRDLWCQHRRFKLIPSSASFFEKIHRTVNVFRQMLVEVENEAQHIDEDQLEPYEISS